ncbi:DUF4913 domain-containing protein [Corynebacterium bovis]|uniref:DUF4913 domain-containing protein n=1 Tax=Corynebacterium bovis TaxID=36808 RepID=UPI003139D7FD
MSTGGGVDGMGGLDDELTALGELDSDDLAPEAAGKAVGSSGGQAGEGERRFATVVDFVEGFVRFAVNRKMSPTPGQGLRWDPDWHMYPEVVYRLTALHEACEEAVATGGSALSVWWVQHFDPHMRVILDGETGPFAAYSEGAISTVPKPLPVTDSEPSPLL